MSHFRARLADRIKYLRELHGISQADLARRVNTSQQEMSEYERGNVLPRPERIEAIAKAIGVDFGELFIDGTPAKRFSSEVLSLALLVERAAGADPTFPRRLLLVAKALLVKIG